MTGAVSWEQLIFIVAVIVFIITTLVAIFNRILSRQEVMHSQNLATYKSTVEEQTKLRNDLRAGIDEKITNVADKLHEESRRIDAIEIFNAGLRMLFQSLDEFKSDVRNKFEEVTRDRKEEVKRIDEKLDKIITAQVRRRREIDHGPEETTS
jgi:hypothetical protein